MKNIEVFDSLLESVFVTDARGGLLYVNDFASQVFDIPSKVAQRKKSLPDYFVNSDVLFSILEKAKKTDGSTPYIEDALSTKGGKEVRVQLSCQIVDTDEFLFYARDVSLEETLHRKYLAELKKKESLIASLDRNVFELKFLLDVVSTSIDREIEHLDHKNLLSLVSQRLKIPFLFTFEMQDGTFVYKHNFGLARGIPLDVKGLIHLVESELPRRQWEERGRNRYHADFDFNGVKATVVFVLKKNMAWHALAVFPEPAMSLVAEDKNLLEVVWQQISLILESQDLYIASITDEKTKVFNHRFFKYRLDQEVKRGQRYEANFSLMVIDLDHFKKVNDNFGHLVGDEVLERVAEKLKVTLRTTDIIARFGGEEFMVICFDNDKAQALHLAERLRAAVASIEVYSVDKRKVPVSASIGISLFPIHSQSAEELISKADQALYEAKNAGRNCVKLSK